MFVCFNFILKMQRIGVTLYEGDVCGEWDTFVDDSPQSEDELDFDEFCESRITTKKPPEILDAIENNIFEFLKCCKEENPKYKFRYDLGHGGNVVFDRQTMEIKFYYPDPSETNYEDRCNGLDAELCDGFFSVHDVIPTNEEKYFTISYM